MRRLYSKKDLKWYTLMLNVLINLELTDKDYMWLISDIEAYPTNEKYANLINSKDYLLLKTDELVQMLKEEDFQWIWAVFSAIPSKYTKEEILSFELPYVYSCSKDDYQPYRDEPKIQHPYAEFEIYSFDSSYMFIISNNEEILEKFKKSYPLYIEKLYNDK